MHFKVSYSKIYTISFNTIKKIAHFGKSQTITYIISNWYMKNYNIKVTDKHLK